MDALTESLRENWVFLMQLLPRLAAAGILVLLAMAVARILGRAVGRFVKRLATAPHLALPLERVTVWVVSLLGFVVALDFLGLSAAAVDCIAFPEAE